MERDENRQKGNKVVEEEIVLRGLKEGLGVFDDRE
jgi:hypothetical protein